MSEELLFSFPPELDRDGIRMYLQSSPAEPRSNVTETFIRLDLHYQGERESFRIPHDLDDLWKRLHPSTATSRTTSSTIPSAPST